MDLLLDGLTVWRGTRLVVKDDITAGLRDKWIEHAYKGTGRYAQACSDLPHSHEGRWADYAARDPDLPKAAQLATCPHCVSMWLTFGAVLLRIVAPRFWQELRWVGALSGANSLVADLIEK